MAFDSSGREISYMRVSVTDRCNLRCSYCMPPDGVMERTSDSALTLEEIVLVAGCAADLGIRRIRLTGGEPLTRLDIVELVAELARLDDVDSVSMTTNGTLLEEHAKALRDAGLSTVNISIDSLDPDRYREVTGGGDLRRALAGLKAVRDAGIENRKVNVVAVRGVNDDEVADFARLTLEDDVEVRFIEMMAMGDGLFADAERFVPASEILGKLAALGRLSPVPKRSHGGPALLYKLEGAIGTLGVVTAVSNPFCAECNRIRLTSGGMLLPCLLSPVGVDLLSVLRPRARPDEITDCFHRALALKPERHLGYGATKMSCVGG